MWNARAIGTIWLSLILLFTVALMRAGATESPLSPEDRSAFAWFDQLGLEDLSKARLVRVRTGLADYPPERKGRPRKADEPRGFLLWERGREFRVLLGDLTASTLRHSGKSPAQDSYVGWREVTVEEEAAALLAAIADGSENPEWGDRHFTSGDRLDLKTQLFVLARFADLHGATGTAARLLHICAKELETTTPEDFQAKLEDKFAYLLDWRATTALADLHQGRNELAQLFLRLAESCPRSIPAEEARDIAPVLQQMAEEDRQHQPILPKDLAALAPSVQAKELVFELRDEGPPSYSDLVRPWPSDPAPSNHAIDRLVLLGHAAVPALLEALGDERPTRSVFQSIRFGGYVRPLAIRELANDALTKIAGGLNFFALSPDDPAPDQNALWHNLRQVAAGWWSAAEAGQEADWLQARILGHRKGSEECSKALAKRFPDRWAETAVKGAQAAQDPWVRSQLTLQLAKMQTPGTDAFLLDELAHGPSLGNRVTAAYLLRKHRRPEALSAMLTEWGRFPHPLPASVDWISIFSAWPSQPSKNPDDWHILLHFLLATDSLETQEAVAERWPDFLEPDKLKLVETVRWILGHRSTDLVEKLGARPRSVLRKILITGLFDDSIELGKYNDVPDPLTGEIAAMILAEYWPRDFHFKLLGEPKARAAQLANARREAKRIVP